MLHNSISDKDKRNFIRTAFNKDILVAAGAGSGKTSVLTDRVVNRLRNKRTDGEYFALDNMLIMTFTEKAALELRERITAKINAALAEPQIDKDLREHLWQQSILVEGAPISTIHSFCMRVIKNNYHLLDIDPKFRMADENEQKLLLQTTLQELLEEMYDTGHQDYEAAKLAADWYADDNDDSKLHSLLLQYYAKALNGTAVEEFIANAAEQIWPHGSSGLMDCQWGRVAISDAWQRIADAFAEAINCWRIAEDIFPMCTELAPLRVRCSEERERAFELLQIPVVEKNIEKLQTSLAQLKFKNWAGKLSANSFVDTPLEEKYNELREIRDHAKNLLVGKNSVVTACCQWFGEDLPAEMDLVKQGIAAISTILLALHQRWQEKKRQRSILDFADLEQYCLQVLKNPAVCSDLAKEYIDVLVDEYQDTNAVQEAIVQLLAANGSNIFMVGDVKQSIYRFRSAEPQIFQKKYEQFVADFNAANCRIDLNINFRSRSAVVNIVNNVFAQLMNRRIAEIDYDEVAQMNFGAISYSVEPDMAISALTELHVINMNQQSGEDSADEESEPDIETSEIAGIEYEAYIIANRIKELVASGKQIFDKEAERWRAISYRDIAILMNSRTHLNSLVAVLRMQGVPLYADQPAAYFAAWEIKLALAILRIIDNPLQDIEMAAVLHSPLYNFTLDELMTIRKVFGKDDNIWQQVMKIYDSRDSSVIWTEALKNKIENFVAMLNLWRLQSHSVFIYELINQVYEDSGLLNFASAMDASAQRIANLQLLLERARLFEQTNLKGLFMFLKYYEMFDKQQQDLEEGKIDTANADVVRFNTIHGSKGLEYPVVILANFNGQLQYREGEVLLDKDWGVGTKVVNLQYNSEKKSPIYNFLQERSTMQSRAEYMRLLYVAMTRAREKLIITARVGSSRQQYKEKQTDKAKSFFDWFVWSLAKSNIIGKIDDILTVGEGSLLESEALALKVYSPEYIKSSFLVADSKPILQNRHDSDEYLLSEEITQQIKNRVARFAESTQLDDVFFAPKITISRLNSWLRTASEPEEDNSEQLFVDIKDELLLQDISEVHSEEEITGRLLGNLYHKVLQHIDYRNLVSEQQVKGWLDGLVEKQFISPEELSAVDCNKIWQMLSSDLGYRIRNAVKIFVEQPFVWQVATGELRADVPKKFAEQKVLLQGIIDLMFIDNEQNLVIVDFKTDKIDKANILLDRHSQQLNLYGRAVEATSGYQVAEKYIWHICSNQVIAVVG